MRTILFILLFFIPWAFAEELTPTSQVSAQAMKHDWAGLYTGIILGGQFGDSENKTGSFGYNADNTAWDYSQSGFIGGAQVGYNHAWDAILIGPEIEMGYVDMGGSGAQPESPGQDTRGETSSDFYTTFRARAGLHVDQYLFFGTVGAIGVNYKTQVVDDCNIAPCGGSTVDATYNHFTWGYTVGAGVERMFWKNVSVKLEYLYFGLEKLRFNGTTNLGVSYDWTGQTSGHMFRSGLNYHF